MPNGVDVSNHQGKINWAALAADMDFAWIKATEGRSYVDPFFAANLNGARASGVPVGAYHFARPDNNSAQQEATHFLGVYRAMPGDLLPVLDFETHSHLSPAQMTQWAATWIDLVTQGLNTEVVLYTYPYFISGDMGGAYALKGTKLWYADYFYGKPWRFKYQQQAESFSIVAHQYTSKGHAGGISGRVDLNYAPDLGGILQTPVRPRQKPTGGVLPGPRKKPKWFWAAVTEFLRRRNKNV